MNIREMARRVEEKGRRGDTVLAHINPKEARLLKKVGGSGTINPKTGALEFWTDTGNEAAGFGDPLGGSTSATDPSTTGGSVGGNADTGGLFDNLASKATSPGVLGTAGSTVTGLMGIGGAPGGFIGNLAAAAFNPDQAARAGMGAVASLGGPVAAGFAINALAQALGAVPDPPGKAAALSGVPDMNPGLQGGSLDPSMAPQGVPGVSASGMQVNRLSTPDWALRELYGNMRFNKGGFITKLARAGRKGDNRLMHVSDNELQMMNRLVPGGLTTNPKTNLPEAFKFKDFLRYAAPVAAFAAPVISEAAFGGTPGGFLADLVGLGGSKIAGGIGDAAVGALLGLGGGDPLGGALAGLGGNVARGDILDLFGSAPAQIYGATGEGSNVASGAPSGRPVTPQQPQGSWINRNSGLVGAGLGALALAGAASPGSSETAAPNNSTNIPAGFNEPLAPVSFTRNQVNPRMNWYRIGRDPGPIMFFDDPRGRYSPMAKGGSVRPTTTEGRRRRSIMNSISSVGPSKGGSSYIKGPEGGQDDTRMIMASPGEYIMDATTVADIGDGNSEAGARKLDKMRDNIARHKGRKKRVPNKAKRPESYLS